MDCFVDSVDIIFANDQNRDILVEGGFNPDSYVLGELPGFTLGGGFEYNVSALKISGDFLIAQFFATGFDLNHTDFIFAAEVYTTAQSNVFWHRLK